MVVLHLVPRLEGQMVVLDLVVYVVLHLALVVLEGLAMQLAQQGVCTL